eukprot:TRINITY_DN22485_c0_g1_i1.p1 TRINITY_DN22485_c0_g1~~TRINITY_DN22485_c0_g1_i1.p1  ORF type:complete len:1543 (+),score=334.82 TRINITY_DN22485_c0_g1_i1:58-4629(+)
MSHLQRVGVPREFSDSFSALKSVPLFFFGVVDKYKKSWKVEKRVVAVTDYYLYTARTGGDISRCIDLKMISEVFVNDSQHQLALKIPRQYDLCIQTPEYRKLADVLEVLIQGTKKDFVLTVLPPNVRVGSSQYPVQLQRPSNYKLEIKNEETVLADDTVTPREEERVDEGVRQPTPLPAYRPSVTPSVPSIVDELEMHSRYMPEPAEKQQSFPQPPQSTQEVMQHHQQSHPHYPSNPATPHAVAPPAPLPPAQELYTVQPTSSIVTVTAPVMSHNPALPPTKHVHSTFGSHQPEPILNAQVSHSPRDVVQNMSSLLPPYHGVEADRSSTITVHVPVSQDTKRETFTPYASTDYPTGYIHEHPSVHTQEPAHPSLIENMVNAIDAPAGIDPIGRWPGVTTPMLQPEANPDMTMRTCDTVPEDAPTVVSSRQPTPQQHSVDPVQPVRRTPVELPLQPQVESRQQTPLMQPTPPMQPAMQQTPPVQPTQQPVQTMHPEFEQSQPPLTQLLREESSATVHSQWHLENTTPHLPSASTPLDAHQAAVTPAQLTPLLSVADMTDEIALPQANIDTSLDLPSNLPDTSIDDQVHPLEAFKPSAVETTSASFLPQDVPKPVTVPISVNVDDVNRMASPPPDYVELPWGKHSPAGKLAAHEHQRAQEAELRAARLLSEIMEGGAASEPPARASPMSVPASGYQPVNNGLTSVRGVSPPRPGRSETPVAASPRTGVKNMLSDLLAAPDTPPRESSTRRNSLELGLPVDASWPSSLSQDVRAKLNQALKCDTAAAIGIAPHQVEIDAFMDMNGTATVCFALNRPDERDEDILSVRYQEMSVHSRIPIPETMRIIRDLGGLHPIDRSRRASASQASATPQMMSHSQLLQSRFELQESTAASSYDGRYCSPESVENALWNPRGDTPSDAAEQQVMQAEQRAADLLSALQHDTQALQADLQNQLGAIEEERQKKDTISNEVSKLKQELRDMTNKDFERSRRHSSARRDMETELSNLKRQMAHQNSTVFVEERRRLEDHVLNLKGGIRNIESQALEKDMKSAEEKRNLEHSLVMLREEIMRTSTEKDVQSEREKRRLEEELETLRSKIKHLDEIHVEKENRSEEEDKKLLTEIERVKREMVEMNASQQEKELELKRTINEREKALNEGTSRIEKELQEMKKEMAELTGETSKVLMQNSTALETELTDIKNSVGVMMTQHVENQDDKFRYMEGMVLANRNEAALETEKRLEDQAMQKDASFEALQKTYTDMIASLESQVGSLHQELLTTKDRERTAQIHMEQAQQEAIQKEIDATAKAEALKYLSQGLPPTAPRRQSQPPAPLAQTPMHRSFNARPVVSVEMLRTCPEYTNVMKMLAEVHAKVVKEVGDKEARLKSVLSLSDKVTEGEEGNTEGLEKKLRETVQETDMLRGELELTGSQLIAAREKRLQSLLTKQGTPMSLPTYLPQRESTMPPATPESIRNPLPQARGQKPSTQRLHESERRLRELQQEFVQPDATPSDEDDVMAQVRACLNRTNLIE